MTPRHPHSDGEYMADIPSLTAEIDRLSQSVSFWNTAIIVLMVGVAVVATGLVIAQQKAFKTADALASATDQLAKLKEGVANQKIAEALRQAGDSNKAAGEANERAGKAEAHLEETKERAANAELQSAEAKKGVLAAETELASQREKAAIAERALLELQENVQSRHLTAKQKADIKLTLEKFPPRSVGVQVFIGTPDGIPYSFELIEAINSSGWNATHKGQSAIGGEIRGVALIMKDVAHPPVEAKQLQDALKAAGIEAPASSDPNLGEDELVVFVAPKKI